MQTRRPCSGTERNFSALPVKQLLCACARVSLSLSFFFCFLLLSCITITFFCLLFSTYRILRIFPVKQSLFLSFILLPRSLSVSTSLSRSPSWPLGVPFSPSVNHRPRQWCHTEAIGQSLYSYILRLFRWSPGEPWSIRSFSRRVASLATCGGRGDDLAVTREIFL